MLWKIGFLAFIAPAIVSVVLSTNIEVVRRLNPDTASPPFADLFSNRQCSSSTCPSNSTCAGGSCCMCQCFYDTPNVFVSRTSLKCMDYEETNRISSAHCQYSFRKTNEPLEVIPLTEQASGKIKFTSDSVRVNCTANGLSVDEWQFLDGDGRWEIGVGNVFVVDFRTVGGQDGNKKDMTFVNWNAKLDAKYAGLIIKLSLSCGGTSVGCILAKINGTHTFDRLQSTTSAPPSTTPQLPSTTPQLPSTTPQSVETTTLSPPLTSEEPLTSGGPNPGLFPGPSTGVPGVIGSDTSSTFKPVPSKAQQEASEEQASNNNGSPKNIWAALGAIGGLICLICLVCLIVALYKRRRRWLSEQPAKDPEIDSEAKLEDYQDPLYAELPDSAQNAGDFDNPTYCDPTEELQIRRSKLDPLPALPADESTYQPLDQNTRANSDPSAPAPPPVSYPLKDAPPEESTDYLNPDREEPDSVDYDNPPVTNQFPMNNESSDYDNPPVLGNTQPMQSHGLEDLNNESSDYDNPPVLGNTPPMQTHGVEDSNNESPDYDNPPVQGIPQGAPSESVPGSAQDAVTEPEYLELEPEDSSL